MLQLPSATSVSGGGILRWNHDHLTNFSFFSSLWIAEEKELLQEMIGLGELREPWHSRQIQILERHLWLVNLYTGARQSLAHHERASSSTTPKFRQSSSKGDPTHEFVPLNLHLQRIWGQNESLHKSGFHDNITVGAFTAYAQGYENGGLIRWVA